MKTPTVILPLFALSCPIALASTDSADTDFLVANSSPAFAVSAEAFYGFDMSDNDVDISGVTFRGFITRSNGDNSRLYSGLFASVRIGTGEDDAGDIDIDAVICFLSLGADFRLEINNTFSAFARVELGAYTVWCDYGSYGDDWSGGAEYGAGVGLQISPSKNHTIIVAVDYIRAANNPEFDVAGYKIKADEPEYITLSVGYKFSF